MRKEGRQCGFCGGEGEIVGAPFLYRGFHEKGTYSYLGAQG